MNGQSLSIGRSSVERSVGGSASVAPANTSVAGGSARGSAAAPALACGALAPASALFYRRGSAHGLAFASVAPAAAPPGPVGVRASAPAGPQVPPWLEPPRAALSPGATHMLMGPLRRQHNVGGMQDSRSPAWPATGAHPSQGPPPGSLPVRLEETTKQQGFLMGPDFLDEASLLAKTAGMRGWQDFVEDVLPCRSPLRQNVHTMPRLHVEAIQKRARFSDVDAASFRKEQIARLRQLAAQDGPRDGPRWGLLHRVCQVLGYDDKTLGPDAIDAGGFRATGMISPSGLWPSHPHEPSVAAETLKQRAQQVLQDQVVERSRGFVRLPNKHRAELLGILREKRDLGYFQEFSLEEAQRSLGDWAGWLFFLVVQGEKRRGCLAPEAANTLQKLPEVTYMCGVDGYVDLCSCFATALQERGRIAALRGFREDYEDGFFQCNMAEEDRRFFGAYAWDEALAKRDNALGVRLFIPSRLLLGPRAGPHAFCRGSLAMSTAAAGLLVIPQLPHVDDICCVETYDGTPSARSALVDLFDIMQFRLKSSKAVPARSEVHGASRLICLGTGFDFEVHAHHRDAGLICHIELPQEKASKYRDQIAHVQEDGSLPYTVASSMCGRWEHAASVALGRSARAFIWPLRDRSQDAKHRGMTRLLDAALAGFDHLLTVGGRIPIYANHVHRRSFLIFVDAARRQGPPDEDVYRLGGVIWGPQTAACFTLDVPLRSCAWLPTHAGNAINEAEALAAVVAVIALQSRGAEADWILFIDNEAAEGVLLKGYSKSPQLTALAGTFWATVRQSAASCWVGRVPSALNVADGFSRDDSTLRESLGLEEWQVCIPSSVKWDWLLQARTAGGRRPNSARMPPPAAEASAPARSGHVARKEKKRCRLQGQA